VTEYVPAGQYIQFDEPATIPVFPLSVYVPGGQMNVDGRDELMRVTEAEAVGAMLGRLLGRGLRGLGSTVVVL